MTALLTLLRSKIVNDTTARPVRGGVQGGAAFAMVDVIDAFHALSKHQFAALLFLLTIVVSVVQNYLENSGRIPALLKTVPAKDDPVAVLDTTPTLSKPAKKAAKKAARKRPAKRQSGEIDFNFIALVFGLIFAVLGAIWMFGAAVHGTLDLLALVVLIIGLVLIYRARKGGARL